LQEASVVAYMRYVNQGFKWNFTK